MSKPVRSTLPLLIAALGVGTAAAQTAETLVVTASRTPQSIADLLGDVTVVREDEIVRSGVQSLPQLLQRQPGVEVTINGGAGGTSGVFIRGANAGQTLVLVDGLRVGSSSTGATSLEAIPLEQVERIEILRGPASSLYGADAIGGVIQVFTKRGQGALSGNVSVSYGTDATGNINAGLRGAAGPVRFSLHAGATESDGFNAIVNPANFGFNPDRDGYSTRNVGGSVAFTWAPGQELAVQGLRNKLDAQSDGGPDFDDRTITTLESFAIVSRNRLADAWSSTLSIGEGRDDSISKSSFGDAPFETRQRQYSWQNDVTLPAGTLSLVLERREERLATTNDFAVTSRDTDSVGVYQLRAGAGALQANLRLDDSSQFGRQTTGGISAGLKVAPEWRVTAGYSTGFKAPSFNDLYFPGFSNPSLVPEESRNTEVGAYWTPAVGGSPLELRAVAYRNRVDKLIVFGCDEDFSICRPDNVAKATLEGATLGFDWSMGGTRIAGSLDLQRPENDANGNLLPRRARQHGTLQLTQLAGPVRIGAEWVASSYRYDDAANTIRNAGYGIVNLTLDWQLARSWTVFVRGNNVFDRDYQLAADYSTGGAAVFAGVRWAAVTRQGAMRTV